MTDFRAMPGAADPDGEGSRARRTLAQHLRGAGSRPGAGAAARAVSTLGVREAEPMRVLMLSWEYPPLIEGGLARHVRKLSENLAARASTCTS